jgi:hypothetical protein
MPAQQIQQIVIPGKQRKKLVATPVQVNVAASHNLKPFNLSGPWEIEKVVVPSILVIFFDDHKCLIDFKMRGPRKGAGIWYRFEIKNKFHHKIGGLPSVDPGAQYFNYLVQPNKWLHVSSEFPIKGINFDDIAYCEPFLGPWNWT